jgi:hypothetical protein
MRASDTTTVNMVQVDTAQVGTTPAGRAPMSTTTVGGDETAAGGTIVHLMYRADPSGGVVRRYAQACGCRYVFCDVRHTMFKNADAIKQAALCVIWNGRQWTTPLAASLCQRRGIPKVFIEQGLLPQSSTFWVDPAGLVGDSVLARDLSWVTPSDLERLRREREALQAKHPRREEGFVLVPLQIHNDSQMLHYTPYNTMEEFVAEVERMYPGQRIIARPHPKGGKNRRFARAECNGEGEFLAVAARASVVVSLTSTCLYEAAVLGVPVVALGDHPLRLRQAADFDRVLAGALALRINRANGELSQVLDRFNIKPLLRPL